MSRYALAARCATTQLAAITSEEVILIPILT